MTEKKRGGARPGAGRPRTGPPKITEEQWQLIILALHEHSVLDPAGNEVINADELADIISDWRAACRHSQRLLEALRPEFDAAVKKLDSYRKRKI